MAIAFLSAQRSKDPKTQVQPALMDRGDQFQIIRASKKKEEETGLQGLKSRQDTNEAVNQLILTHRGIPYILTDFLIVKIKLGISDKLHLSLSPETFINKTYACISYYHTSYKFPILNSHRPAGENSCYHPAMISTITCA